MKVVILAGGYGTRLSEETDIRPKPMVEIGGMPILWHIMKIYSSQGFNDFIICLGYKGDMIKRYFSDLYLQSSDFTIDTSNGEFFVHKSRRLPFIISLYALYTSSIKIKSRTEPGLFILALVSFSKEVMMYGINLWNSS